MLTRHLLPALLLSLSGLALAEAPAGDVPLAALVEALRKDPQAAAALEQMLAGMGTQAGAATQLSPEQRAALRARLQAALKEGGELPEAWPAFTVAEMGAAVTAARASGVGTDGTNQGAAPSGAGESQQGLPGGPVLREPLGIPVPGAAGAPPATPQELGLGVTRGREEPDPALDARWPASARLAEVLNRLALNPPGAPRYVVTLGDAQAASPAELLALLEARGHTLQVVDVRVFADFADLSWQGRDVAAAVWADTGIAVPGADGRTLKVPVTHSQHELVVRGPLVQADVSFFMGIDGQAQFRPMQGKRPGWSGRRVAHTYTGDQAREAIRLAGEVRRAFTEKAAANPDLPWGGYFVLGVCNDSNALIEHGLTGRTTLFPLTRDLSYYQGPGEIDRISRAMPVDGRGAPADLERVLASLPAEDPAGLFFPGLRADVQALTAQGGAAQEGLSDKVQGLPAPR